MVFCRGTIQYVPDSLVTAVYKEFFRFLSRVVQWSSTLKNSNPFCTDLPFLRNRMTFWRRTLPHQSDPASDIVKQEAIAPGQDYYRPWSWYLEISEKAGFRVENQFSWQLFFWKMLKKHGIAKPVERVERLLRQIPITERLICHDGIQYFALMRKP